MRCLVLVDRGGLGLLPQFALTKVPVGGDLVCVGRLDVHLLQDLVDGRLEVLARVLEEGVVEEVSLLGNGKRLLWRLRNGGVSRGGGLLSDLGHLLHADGLVSVLNRLDRNRNFLYTCRGCGRRNLSVFHSLDTDRNLRQLLCYCL